MTMMTCINGAGMALPPMFVVKGKTKRCLTSFETSDAPKESVFNHQPNAWMDDSLGVEWFQGVFLKHCGPHMPHILIRDSHRSHETLDVILKANENGILMFTFPPHTTHFLCPLDRTVFGPFQKAYNRVSSEFISSSNETINKSSIYRLIADAMKCSFTRSNIVSGFDSTGIALWNPLAIPADAFNASRPTALSSESSRRDSEHPLVWCVKKHGLDPTNVHFIPATPLSTPSVVVMDNSHMISLPVVSSPTDMVAPRVQSATITSATIKSPDTSLLADSLVVDVAADVLLPDSINPDSINPALPAVQPLEVIFPDGSQLILCPFKRFCLRTTSKGKECNWSPIVDQRRYN